MTGAPLAPVIIRNVNAIVRDAAHELREAQCSLRTVFVYDVNASVALRHITNALEYLTGKKE